MENTRTHSQALQHSHARKDQELHATRCQLDDLHGRVQVSQHYYTPHLSTADPRQACKLTTLCLTHVSQDMQSEVQHARTRLATEHSAALHDAQAGAAEAQRHVSHLLRSLGACLAVAGLAAPPMEGDEGVWLTSLEDAVSAMQAWVDKAGLMRADAEARCAVLEGEVAQAREGREAMQRQLEEALAAQQATVHEVGRWGKGGKEKVQ